MEADVDAPFDAHLEYLRSSALPSVWCPGCGNGTIVRALTDAVDHHGWSKDEVVVIGGIGCSGRTPYVLDFNTMHTTHGRAPAFATGLKMARPDLSVVLTMGDGDSVGIGGNHFIHACRRNIDLTALIYNNEIYGLTGGQAAPTTPSNVRTTTSLDGQAEPCFDICALATAAGASFVARSTVFDYGELEDLTARALGHPGFSVLEILTPCPTYRGRLNDLEDSFETLEYVRDVTSPEPARENGSSSGDEAVDWSYETGVFVDEIRTEYVDEYHTHRRAPEDHG